MLLFVIFISSLLVNQNLALPTTRPDNSIQPKSANPPLTQENENSINQPASLISSETVQQVLHERRTPRSTKVELKSKLPNSVKGGDLLVEYETETRAESKAECRLKSMFLRVDELGWRNRVLAPHGFEFSYCEGPCKPIEFTPLPLIVQEGHRIKLRIYDDLLVSKCG